MKKFLFILLAICLFLTGCKKEEELKSSLQEDNGVYSVVLNNKEHTFKIVEENTKKSKRNVTITIDDVEILKYVRVYSGNYQYDKEYVSLVKGKDNKSYLVYAVGNWTGSKYDQYLYIINDEGNVIHHIDDKKFGAAFTDYSNVEEIDMSTLYGQTGMTKVEDDKITYLTDFGYTPGEDYVRCQENVITIDNNEITETKGTIIKTGRIS